MDGTYLDNKLNEMVAGSLAHFVMTGLSWPPWFSTLIPPRRFRERFRSTVLPMRGLQEISKIHCEERSRRLFTLPARVPLPMWTLPRMTMDNVNLAHILYGINRFILGASSLGHIGLVHMKFFYRITLITKIRIIIVNIY